MLTNYKFYEGVPVGPDNFNEFYNTLFKNSDAIMTLAFASGGTVELQNDGGHLQTNPVGFKTIVTPTLGTPTAVYYVLSATLPRGTGTVLNADDSKGIVFGKAGKRYFTDDIPYIRTPQDNNDFATTSWNTSIEDMKVYAWETLVSGFSVEDYIKNNSALVYKNTNVPTAPYRIVKIKETAMESPYYDLTSGVMDLRYNGIPQTKINGNDLRLITDNPASKDRYATGQSAYSYGQTENSIRIDSNFVFGAEYPSPVSPTDGKFKFGTVEGNNTAEWLQFFSTDGKYIDIRFSHSNFTLDQAHIIVRREADPFYNSQTSEPEYNNDVKYLYLQEDITGGGEVQDGFFKIMDKAKGIVRINLSQNMVLAYLRNYSNETIDKISYTFVCPEQLLESLAEDSTIRYVTRYGDVYTGSYLDTELVSISADLNSGRFEVNRIDSGINADASAEATSIVYTDRASSAKTAVLAIKYPAVNKVQSEPQKLTYSPDVLTMYYVSAVPRNQTNVQNRFSAFSIDQVKTIIEINKASWYNQDVKSREYKPVSRADRSYISIVPEGLVGSKPTIDPLKVIFRYNSGPSENYYISREKALWPQNSGTKEEYVRRDAALPEPHYINPPIVKNFLEEDEALDIRENYQMSVKRSYYVQGSLVVNGELFVD